MSGRTAKFVSAIFAGVLAGIPLATIAYGATPAAEDCLSGPKDQAPDGSHWYYRIDHATKRHCWYLRGENLSQNAAANAAASAKPVSTNAETATQRSIEDAHAELPAQTAIEQPKRSNGLAPAIAADASTATPAAETAGSLVASRWPEQSATASPAGPARPGTIRASPHRLIRARCHRPPRPRLRLPQRTHRLKIRRARFRRYCSSFSAHWRWQV